MGLTVRVRLIGIGGSVACNDDVGQRQQLMIDRQRFRIGNIEGSASEFSGDKIQMRVIGAGFERAPGFELPIMADSSQLVFDLKALSVPPGEYQVSFLGGGVVKYRAREAAQPRDIADIIVAEPFTIRVQPVEKK